MVANWTFLTSHALVLLCIAHDPGGAAARHSRPAWASPSAAHGIVTDLTETGYVVKQKTAAATATRSRHACRCQNPTGGNAPSARSWPSWPERTRGYDRRRARTLGDQHTAAVAFALTHDVLACWAGVLRPCRRPGGGRLLMSPEGLSG